MLQKTLSSLDSKGTIKGLYGFSSKYHGIVGLVLEGFNFVVSIGAIPFKLINYKNIGERSFGTLAFLISLLFYFVITICFTLLTGFGMYSHFDTNSKITTALIYVFSVFNFSTIYMLMFFYYGLKFMKKRFKDYGKLSYYKHSYYSGDLRKGTFEIYKGRKLFGFSGNNENSIRMIFIPFSYFKGGLYFMGFASVILGVASYFELDGLLSIFILPVVSILFTSLAVILSSVFAFLEEYGIYKRIKDSILDMADSEQDIRMLMNKKALLLNKNMLNEGQKLISQPTTLLLKRKVPYPVVRVYRNGIN